MQLNVAAFCFAPTSHCRWWCFIVVWSIWCVASGQTAPPSEITSQDSSSGIYERSVKLVFTERCIACHGALKQEAGLRLDTARFAIAGGDSGAAITPSDTQSSLILSRVTSQDMSIRMPPEGEPLKAEQIEGLSQWIAQGAGAPENEQAEKSPLEHWAFQSPKKPSIPVLEPSAGASVFVNPIDAFLEQARRSNGLVAQPSTDRRLWLRRISLDLVGLPPTTEEQSAFLADESQDAYERVAARLLESPQYGERWGRHWMDVWRYSDWWGLGAEVRNSQKHVWHWRDWIVESMNEDKGYDQMIREMLAADELYPNDLNKLRASGFLARQYFLFNRTSWLDETVEHTSKAMMGLTMNCSKCHDHKYDPIRQEDYYQLRAIFEPYQVCIDLVPGQVDPEQDGIPRAFDCNLDSPTYVHVRGDDRNPDTTKKMEPSVPAFLLASSSSDPSSNAPAPFVPSSITLPPEAYDPGSRSFIVESYVSSVDLQIEAATKKLSELDTKIGATETSSTTGTAIVAKAVQQERTVAAKALAALNANKQAILARSAAQQAKHKSPDSEECLQAARNASRLERIAASATADQSFEQAQWELLQQEEAQAAADKLEEAKKKVAAATEVRDSALKSIELVSDQFTPLVGSIKTRESNLETEESRRKPFPTTSTGRRTALAQWLTHRSNPLTARVAVNHLWARHMGSPLVPTVFDFGRKGKPPTNQALLDWLAMELIDSGWSMKHMHRLMVTSQAYRMSSSALNADAETIRKDPENRFYWRANTGRMESQMLRDSLLHLANVLDLRLGGPPIPAAQDQSFRRSLYYFHSHNEHNKFLSMFDDASVLDCYRRAQSIVPQQALALENSQLALDCSQKIADWIVEMSTGTDGLVSEESFVRSAFRLILATDPSSAEMEASLRGLSRWTQVASQLGNATPETLARVNLIHALINHNDFITIR
jgi:mono/diheme cytochrome c family protein